MRRVKWLVIVLGVFAATSCDISGPSGCDVCTTSAIVYGAVRSADGQPLSARITIEARAPSCRASGIGANNGFIATDSQGNYRGFVISPVAPTAVCLLVLAQPTDSVRFRAVADTGHVVRLENSSQDSVRVDLIVRPAA